MSGHSHWATIRRKKGAADAKRGQAFTRLAREIAMAARTGGGDPNGNFRLSLAIEKARASNMPKDSIDRAIKRGAGEDKDATAFEEFTLEGYGPQGSAIMVECVTDNRNRTVADIRHAFSKNGGNMGEQGSVAWMFERRSQIFVPSEKVTEDQLMAVVLDAGADDLRNDGDHWEILSAPDAHEAILKALEAAGMPSEDPSIAMVPKNLIKLEGKQASGMLRLQEALEDHDDVQNVYSNFDIDEKELEAMA